MEIVIFTFFVSGVFIYSVCAETNISVPWSERGSYINECNQEHSVRWEKNYYFNLNQSNCWHTFKGSVVDKCIVELVCSEMHFEFQDCKSKFFQLSDDHDGKLISCNKRTFSTPHRASNNATDLTISYVGPIKSYGCFVSCGEVNSTQYKALLPAPIRKVDHTCVCGEAKTQQGRIIGGDETLRFEFPWLAALVFKDSREVFCGASLINDEYLLSAAHCFYPDMTPDLFEIVLHSHVMDLGLNQLYNESSQAGEEGSIAEVKGLNLKNYTDEDESSIRLQPLDVFLHPDYDDTTVDYDLALIKLKTKVDLHNPLIRPICLPSQNRAMEYSKKNATVAGWGRPLAKSGAGNRILQKLDIPLFYFRKCQRLMNELTPRMICGGYLDGGKDSCVGDSGGPLIFKFNERQYRQIGVTSFGIGCALKDLPGIYTNLQIVIPWVYENTEDALWCRDE